MAKFKNQAELGNKDQGWADKIIVPSGDVPIQKLELELKCYNWRPSGLWKPGEGSIWGIIYHATGDCGTGPEQTALENLKWVLEENRTSVHFGIDRLGNIAQYLPIYRKARHAEEADEHWIGIEHIQSIECGHTRKQLTASAQLSASIIKWVEEDLKDPDNPNDPESKGWGSIPIQHASNRPPHRGLADHRQGGWLWGNHMDGLTYGEFPVRDIFLNFKPDKTWKEFVHAVSLEMIS